MKNTFTYQGKSTPEQTTLPTSSGGETSVAQYIRDGNNLRFVAITMNDSSQQIEIDGRFADPKPAALVRSLLEQHSLNPSAFLGAGVVQPSGPEFGSHSCDQDFGRCKPKSPGVATQLLSAIRTKLTELGYPFDHIS